MHTNRPKMTQTLPLRPRLADGVSLLELELPLALVLAPSVAARWLRVTPAIVKTIVTLGRPLGTAPLLPDMKKVIFEMTNQGQCMYAGVWAPYMAGLQNVLTPTQMYTFENLAQTLNRTQDFIHPMNLLQKKRTTSSYSAKAGWCTKIFN